MVQRHLIAALLSLAPVYAYSCSPAPFLLDRFQAAEILLRTAYLRNPQYSASYRTRAQAIRLQLAPELRGFRYEDSCGHFIESTRHTEPLLRALIGYAEGGTPILFGNVEAPFAKLLLKSTSGTQTTTANADGHYLFPVQHPGRHHIQAFLGNQRIAFRTFDDGYIEEFEIPASASASLDGIRMRTLGLAGRLLTATGAPISNARVTAVQPGESRRSFARTNSTGYFHIPNLEPGAYQLVASSANGQPDPNFRSTYYANKAILEVPKNGQGKQDIEFRANPAPKLIPIRAFLTRGSYGDHLPGEKISFHLLNANSHVDLLNPEIDFSCTIDSALSCFIPLVEGELYRPPGVLLPEWTVRATPGGYIHLW